MNDARLLEAEQSALASHVSPCRLSVFVCCRLSVFVCCCLSLGTEGAGGGGRGNVALSDVYVHSGCVAANLAVSCELVCVCVSLERVVIICLASIHTA